MRRIVDDQAKDHVVFILGLGGSRQEAANFINCHPRTIYNAEKRDPVFADRVRTSYATTEMSLLRTILKAGREGGVSSAKWLLERVNPDRYVKRKPGCYTHAMVQSVFTGLAETFAKLAPDDSHRDFALRVMTEYSKEQLVRNEPVLKDCMPMYRECPDYVEEARKFREEEYARIDAEEEIAYREYEAKKAAERAAREAQEQTEKAQAEAEKAQAETGKTQAPIAQAPQPQPAAAPAQVAPSSSETSPAKNPTRAEVRAAKRARRKERRALAKQNLAIQRSPIKPSIAATEQLAPPSPEPDKPYWIGAHCPLPPFRKKTPSIEQHQARPPLAGPIGNERDG